MFEERIENSDLNEEMRASFLEYAYSVIYARALPDARDGLKPVQRRILYQMSQMNLYPDRPYVKSARVVGDVMGKLHPHGDSAIYDAMVRLTQEWVQRIPLVDGHGNFGSLDNGPAAARYTEARMAISSVKMCEDLDEDVVDFVPNYDNKLKEPEVLPAAIPNLLVNGSTGIAVGMATNIAPHNLREVVQAAVFLMNNPDCTVEDLMKFVPGPDFPSGGIIIDLEPIKEAYQTGRGIVKMRAKTSFEKVGKKQAIIVHELPYGVGPETVLEKINLANKAGKIQGIAKADDLTDRHSGLNMQILVKNGFNPTAILDRLLKLTPLETSFGINNVALVDGAPKTLGLKEMLKVWIEHRQIVIRRRTEFRLKARQDRLHLVEGLLIAILDIDEVIQVIRSSDDTPEATTRLMTVFDLDEIQAQYILDLRLRRLTKFSKIELETEKAKLEEEIEQLQAILRDPELLKAEVTRLMHETVKEFGTDRRTQLAQIYSGSTSALDQGGAQSNGQKGLSSDLLSNFTATSASTPALKGANKEAKELANLEVQDAPCYILLSATGLIARVVRGAKEEQAKPPMSENRAKNDAITACVKTSTRSKFGVLTSLGRVLTLSAFEVPEIARGENVDLSSIDKNTAGIPKLDRIEITGAQGGADIRQILSLNSGETVVTVIDLTSDTDAKPLAIGTTFGVVKRVKIDELPHDRGGNMHDEWLEITLEDGDTVVGAARAGDEDDLVFITTDSSLLKFPASKVRPQGRSAGGMAGIKLAEGQTVVSFNVLSKAEVEDTVHPPLVLTVAGDNDALPGTQNGFGKLTPYNLYPYKGRATGGVRSQKFLKGQNALIFAWAGPGVARANTANGTPVDWPEIDERRDGSGKLLDAQICCIG
ncbi:MAG: DNA topoisomerase IV subunit A [Candidatus Ancillula sp.]|jgi:DNA gyrase subunit A|nr:DNA topoisomerase IV subunit A [Candidatus Ancillula sp.]